MSYLWLVTNGYQGNGYVTVIVEALDELAARQVASPVLKATQNSIDDDPSYWQIESLQVERITLPYQCELG